MLAVDRMYRQEFPERKNPLNYGKEKDTTMNTETKNENTYYVHEDMLGDSGTEAQARRMVEFLRERGYDVEYGQSIEQDEYAIADQDWHDGLDLLSAEMVE